MKILVQTICLTVFYLAESILPHHAATAGRRGHALRNILFGIINALPGLMVTAFITVSAIHTASESSFGLLRQVDGPFWLESAVAVVLFDLWMYVWHRANHRIPFLWRFHRVHHSDPALDVTSAFRFHAGEILISSLLRSGILVLLGMEWSQLILYELCLQPVILFHHSNIALPGRVDRTLRSLIVSPDMHRVHHSDIRRETDSNYASIFSIWDRLFQTCCQRRTDTIVYGLAEYRRAGDQSFGGMFLTPWRRGGKLKS